MVKEKLTTESCLLISMGTPLHEYTHIHVHQYTHTKNTIENTLKKNSVVRIYVVSGKHTR